MNQTEARQFVETIFSRYFHDRDGFVELRFVGQAAVSKFLPKGEITEADWDEVCRLNRAHHVFVGVNPRPLSKLKKQSDIKDVVCLWADVDGKDYEGGKEEALQKVQAFAPVPSIVVDSGHGYHAYWVLEQPIINLVENRRLRFRKILAGLIKAVGGDKSKVHFDSCLRLPGTNNIKGAAITECRILGVTDKVYGIDEFEPFIDSSYQEPEMDDGPLPEFGTKTREIRRTNSDEAIEDVGKLEVASKVKNLIITGALLREKSADRTRSGRDFSIICSLIFFDYDYRTIQSVFFNPFLGCSNRVLQEGEDKLRWDVKVALERVKNRVIEGTPQSAAVSEIKAQKMSPDEKRQQINAVITRDLLAGPEPAGIGFKDSDLGRYYFFDSGSKDLMPIEGTDFYCFLRARFGISKAEFDERKDAVMTEIREGGNVVTARRFSHWDKANLVLYVSDHDNGIYKLDGEKIEFCPNGTDGVFFEYSPFFTPFKFAPGGNAAVYFEAPKPAETVTTAGIRIEIPAGTVAGLDLDRYRGGGSLLKKYVLDRASFAETEDNPLPPESQELVLLLYVYSQFFESQMREKPIVCLVGIKESGKSFLATSIGKLFFGDKFEAINLPKTAHDLAVVMASSPYLVVDNVDSRVDAAILDTLCGAATGIIESNRKLFDDVEVVSIAIHCFLAITSREPKFARDDLVSRFLLFNTRKIDNPISRSELIGSFLENRGAIMTEVLLNANSIVKRLRAQARMKKAMGPKWGPVRCVSRNADWETWARSACGWKALVVFGDAIDLMNQGKNKFVLDDDYIYQTLHWALYEKGAFIRNVSAQELYSLLCDAAKEMKIAGFDKALKSAVSLGKRLKNIAGEMRQEMDVEIAEGRSNRKTYTFKAFGDERPDPEKGVARPTDEEVFEDVKKRAGKLAGKEAETTIVKADFDREPPDS